MSRHIVVDPISRIEGQLRIEAVLDDSNTITTAYSAGTMFRGIELILQGRDPRDAGLLAMRICGVCTGVHYWTSIRAVEDAFDLTLTKNARLVRNLIQASLFMHDHPVHFYQLHALDWVDLVSSLSADPKKAVDVAYSYSDSPYNASLATYQAVQQKLTAFVKAGSLGIFGNAYWGNPSYELTPAQNLVAVSHYLDALTIQRTAAKMMAILGGKNPHPQSIVVGGVTCVEDIQNPAELALFGQYLSEVTQFVQTAYLPDLLMVGTVYAKQGLDGIGAGLKSYMAYGDFPLTDAPDSAKLFSRGLVLDGDLSTVYPVDQANVREDIAHSWYQGDWSKHPYVEETVPDYTGLDKRSDGIAYLKTDQKYSWLKAPTYDGHRVEVGPLARLVVGYASGNQTIVQHVDALLKLTGFPASVLFSTLGRTAARCVETMIIADAMVQWLNELQLNVASGDTTTWTNFDFGSVSQDTEGVGMSEAPRGALAHWVVIKDAQIDNYQAVVPTTWNASPRDGQGRPGAYEASLVGVKLANPQEPLEILRTIHSFDPCLACAVHLVDARGKEISSCEVIPSAGVPMV
jgi:quinone-reactive Ni/Fe-hydrogenase large subunit